MDCKVSVVIPFYNGIEYLQDCVRSVQAQTLREIEILLVDDGSTDGSGTLADKLAQEDPRVRVIHQENRGLSGARNSGIDASRGDYIGFVDADDLVDPQMYEKLYDAASSLSCELVTCTYNSFRETGLIAVTKPLFAMHTRLSPADVRPEMPRLVRDGSLMFVWRRLYAASLLRGQNIRFDERLRICEDATFVMECLLRADGVAAIPDCLYHYRFVPTSLIRSKKYTPHMTPSMLLQYEIKKRLTQMYLPDVQAQMMTSLADYTYRHISRLILTNLFRKPDKRYREFRTAVRAPIFRDLFRFFDLNAHRSKSLDWTMYKCLRLRLNFPAYCIAKLIFGKDT